MGKFNQSPSSTLVHMLYVIYLAIHLVLTSILSLAMPPPPEMQQVPCTSPKLQPTDTIVIVGGGIAGLVAALELQARDISFTVLEQRANADIANSGAELGLWPSAVQILKKHIPDPAWWDANAMRVDVVDMFAFNSTSMIALRTVNMHRVTDKRGYYLISRRPLMHKLRSLIVNNRIVYNAHVIKFKVRSTGVVVGYKTPGATKKWHVVHARLAIGADGVKSECREFVTGSHERNVRYAGEICYRGLVDLSKCTPDQRSKVQADLDAVGPNAMALVMGAGFRASFSYINEDKSMVCWWVKEKMHTVRESTVAKSETPWALYVRKVHGLTPVVWPQVLVELQDMTLHKDYYMQKIIDRVPESTWNKNDQVVLVGDAAHPVTPNMAQGATMAIEDVHYLVRLMDLAPSLQDAIDEYVKHRQPHAAKVAAESYKQAKLDQMTNPVLLWFRHAFLKYLPRSVFEQRLADINMWREPDVPMAWNVAPDWKKIVGG